MPRNVCTRVSLSISGESSCCLLVACSTAHPTKPSSPSSRTAPEIPLTLTSTCFTCRLSAWAEVALSQEHALSPDPAYGSHTWKKQLHPPLCTNSEMTPLKSLTKKVWYMWISSKPHIDFLFFLSFFPLTTPTVYVESHMGATSLKSHQHGSNLVEPHVSAWLRAQRRRMSVWKAPGN